MSAMFWTPEAIRTLKKLWDRGKSTIEIGKELGISKNAVVGKAHRLGLNNRESPMRRLRKEARMSKQAKMRMEWVRLVDLKINSCRWPIGEPDHSDFHFCGKEVKTGKPYCAEHCKKAYTSLKELTMQNAKNTIDPSKLVNVLPEDAQETTSMKNNENSKERALNTEQIPVAISKNPAKTDKSTEKPKKQVKTTENTEAKTVAKSVSKTPIKPKPKTPVKTPAKPNPKAPKKSAEKATAKPVSTKPIKSTTKETSKKVGSTEKKGK